MDRAVNGEVHLGHASGGQMRRDLVSAEPLRHGVIVIPSETMQESKKTTRIEGESIVRVIRFAVRDATLRATAIVVSLDQMHRLGPTVELQGVGFVALVLTAALTPFATASAQGRHADKELEALLPTTLGGVALTVESQAGTELSTNSAAFDAFLKSLGKARADFTLASAYAQGGLKAQVGAWRVKGADPALLLPGFKDAVQGSSATPLTKADDSLGGRAVTRIGDPGQLTQGPLYAVVRGDMLLFVQTPDRSLAEEAMGKLP